MTAGYLPYTVPAGEDTILRDAMLYFLPDGVRDDARPRLDPHRPRPLPQRTRPHRRRPCTADLQVCI